MRILLAEDNIELSNWLARLLRRDNFAIDCVHRGDDADAALASQDYALAIVDIGLPHLDGIEVVKRLRARGSAIPVIILTANDAVSSRVKGLDSGADDYIVKPFNAEELEARIRAQLRRTRTNFDRTLSCGALQFDSVSRGFTLDGEPLALTPREHAVLETLIQRAGKPVPKDALAASVFGFDDEANPSAVEVYVHRVRRKIEGRGASIATLRGLGYILRAADAG